MARPRPRTGLGRRWVGEIQRWEAPVRWHLHVAGPDAAAALADVEFTFAPLAAVTGLDIARAAGPEEANLDIFLLGPEDYPAAIDRARRTIKRSTADRIRDFRTSRTPCNLRAYPRASADGPLPKGSYFRAMVLIRTGFSDTYRLGCIEEELAQVMGLVNDDDRVRPSVFNDDEEFALLTTHDELLLRVLYDSRLRAGMTGAEAMPIVARIIEDLRPDG